MQLNSSFYENLRLIQWSRLRFGANPSTAISLVIPIVLALMASPVAAAILPQQHAYQRVLRQYMATLAETDFQVDLKPVTYVPEYFQNSETLARYGMLTLPKPIQPSIPSHSGFRLDPAMFTLQAIEAGDTVNMMPMDPVDVAWWAQWRYPGNPHFDSRPLKLRAFVAAAVDMMMLDQDHAAGKYQRTDYLGGSMIRYGYTFYVVKNSLPANVREAYAAGLIRMFEKLEQWPPRGGGGSDMEFFQLVGLWYAAQALGEDYPARALKRTYRVLDTVVSQTGYEKHGGAFDVSYQGIALRFLTWAAMLYKDPRVNEALHKMLVLKSHLSLPEPDGALNGPTHFNTGTADDAPHDQWAWADRDAAMAMLDNEALYTVWSRIGIWTPERTSGLIQATFTHMSSLRPDPTKAIIMPDPTKAAPWRENHWVRGLNFAFDHYHQGFPEKLALLDRANSPLTRPPYGRNDNFIRDLNSGGELLAVKFGGYGAIIHTGRVATRWANGVSGKSGGSLSAFWTPARGTVILGRSRAAQGKAPDEWTDENKRGPYTWAVHAITGKSAQGHYFSSSRLLNVESRFDIQGQERAVVTVRGDLAGSATADPQDQLKGAGVYSREFRIENTGLTVTSSLRLEGNNSVRELWEMIPAYIGEKPGVPLTQISFRVNGVWQDASETLVAADAIRLSRYNAAATITFPEIRRMKLSPDPGDELIGGAGKVRVRNIMIDLMNARGTHTVSYRLAAAP